MPEAEHPHPQETDAHEKPASPEEKKDTTREQQDTSGAAHLEQTLQVYMHEESEAARTKIANDVEYRTQRVEKNLGYVPYLEALLREVEDRDEWFGDNTEERTREHALLRSAADAVRANLADIAKTLDGDTGKNARSYEKLRSVYTERSSRFAELLASVDEHKENAELRDAEAAAKQVQETIRHMTTEEAIDWVSRMMASIDGNDWQSKGLKETYGRLALACRQALRVKLAQEKAQMLQNPSLAKDYARHCMGIAKLFTGRDSPIDADLTDVDFAVEMAKEAMGFEELALRYAERTLKENLPLKEKILTKRPAILQKIQNLPQETQQNPQVQQMMETINASPETIQGLSAQYAVLRNLEVLFEGTQAVNVEVELNELLSKPLESAMEKFEVFLNGTWKGAANLEDIAAAMGPPGLSPQQQESWKLLADIQGYGYDIGDKTWSTIGAGAKIAAMIAAGVAIGIATGGLGVVGAALVGGAAMTVTNALINQQGFDNLSDAMDVYGKDFAVNATTMGAARYLAAGRAAYQLGRAGALSEAGGVRGLFQLAGQRGGLRIVNSFDDASGIGTRLVGATLEGSADTVVGATLDTAVQGGEFLDNLKNNAMFFGLGYAEFAGPAIRGLRGLPPEELHGVAQMVQSISTERTKLQEHCRGTGLDPKALMEARDLQALLMNVPKEKADAVIESVTNLRAQKMEFEETIKRARPHSSVQELSGKDIPTGESVKVNKTHPEQKAEHAQEEVHSAHEEHPTAPAAIETPPAAADLFIKEAFFAAGGGKGDAGISSDYANNVLTTLVSSFDGNAPPELRQRWRDRGIHAKITYDEYIMQQINEWNANPSNPKISFENPAIQRLRNERLNAVVASISENDSDVNLREKLHAIAEMIHGPGSKHTQDIDRQMGYESARQADASTTNDVHYGASQNIQKSKEHDSEAYLVKQKSNGVLGMEWSNLLASEILSRVQVFGEAGRQFHAAWLNLGRYPGHSNIPRDSLTYRCLTSEPGSREHTALLLVEQLLAQAFSDAKAFFLPGTGTQAGFVVEGSTSFGMEVGGQYGVRVSYLRTEMLLKNLLNNNAIKMHEMQDFLKGEFVHEITHSLREEVICFEALARDEVASHAVQFLSLRGKNDIFNRQMTAGMEAGSASKNRYDVAQTAALKVVYLEFSKLADSGACSKPLSYSPADLRTSIESVNEVQQNRILQEVSQKIIETSGDDLIARGKTVEEIGVRAQVTGLFAGAEIEIHGEVSANGEAIPQGKYTVVEKGNELFLKGKGASELLNVPYLKGMKVAVVNEGTSVMGAKIPQGEYSFDYAVDEFSDRRVPILVPNDGSAPYTINFSETKIERIR